MSALLAKLALGIICFSILAIVLFLIVPRKRRKTHFQSKTINKTSYNINSIEHPLKEVKDEKLENYLDQKQNECARPLNQGEYEMYND